MSAHRNQLHPTLESELEMSVSAGWNVQPCLKTLPIVHVYL